MLRCPASLCWGMEISRYTPTMPFALDKGLLVVAFSLWLVALGCGIAAARLEISKNKGLFRKWASVLFATGLCVLSLSFIVTSYKGRHFSVDGYVEEAHVLGGGRSKRTDVWVRVGSGDLVLRASGANIYFRPGEHVILTYQEYSGSILKARFFSSAGKQDGAYNNADFLGPCVCLLIGIVLIWGSIRLNRRDPEGAETNERTGFDPYDSVDSLSLLHLSSAVPENRNHSEDW
jgi:hypothetical protein